MTNDTCIDILKQIYSFNDIIMQAADKNEPSIISRYLIDLAQKFSSFYNDNKIIVDDEKQKNARIYLTYIVGLILKSGAKLLGIETPNKM